MLEVEAKFQVDDLKPIRSSLKNMGAVLREAGGETDIYYNYESEACGDLALSDEALRLRIKSGGAELTYKGPRGKGPYKRRVELTVNVSSPETMADMLRRLGFAEVAVIRKIRETYRLGDVNVSLDSVEGLGFFVEIEYVGGKGDPAESIGRVAEALGLRQAPITESYLELSLRSLGLGRE